MMRSLRLVALLIISLAPAPLAPPVKAAAQPCTFRLGFKLLRDQIPAVVGDCLEDERANPQNGDALQRTTGGLLVWRKADNWTAFTDGATTWLNGPFGLQSRPNSGRFSWESEPSTDTIGQPASGIQTSYPQPTPRPTQVPGPPPPPPPAPQQPAPELASRCSRIATDLIKALAPYAKSAEQLAGAREGLIARCRQAAIDYGVAGVDCFEWANWQAIDAARRGVRNAADLAESLFARCVAGQ